MIQTTVISTTDASRVEPGQFLEVRYRDSDSEPSTRNVLALVYEEENKLLHALDLQHFTDRNLVRTGKELAQQSQDEEEFGRRLDEENVVALPNVQDDEIEQWYETEYKKGRYKENPYRTFREDRIRLLREIEVQVV